MEGWRVQMSSSAVYVTASALVTPAGCGIKENLDALFSGRNFFSAPCHFDSRSRLLGVDHTLDEIRGNRTVSLLEKLRGSFNFNFDAGDTVLFLATTVGAVDLVEKKCDGTLYLLEEAKKLFQVRDAVLISAACASGQTAIRVAMEKLQRGFCRKALVVGIDSASEFVTSGFSALGAVSNTICRPYSIDRDGLVLGEAAAAVVLETTPVDASGRIVSVAENCDARHITAPDLGGEHLAMAISSAVSGVDVAGVIGHGTGTKYNDISEIHALQKVFGTGIPPLFSLKGNFGHTLGATGVLQTAVALGLAGRMMFPPQANLTTPEEGAQGCVSNSARSISGKGILSLNIGFGGLNSALFLEGL